ncbi:MAG TPA: hypothetical protein VK359_00190 [Rubrobacteraceae bacterium]|nr:hypothetical protein [Rubrobacteraceae bacterium]
MDRIEVRWGRSEDGPAVAELLESNGVPCWVAFEESFIVAVGPGGEVMAALRYRTASGRLFLGLLVADQWGGEGALARALHAGAGDLAHEIGMPEVVAERYGDLPCEAGYYQATGGWRLEMGWAPEGQGELPASGWRRVVALLGMSSVPFFSAFRAFRA